MSAGGPGKRPFGFSPAAWVAAALVAAGAWSALTIRFQTELTPLFPPGLAAVRAIRALEASADENAVLLVPVPGSAVSPELAEEVATRLRLLPDVAEAEPCLMPPGVLAKLAAARVAALPEAAFAEVTAVLANPAEMAARLERTRGDMLGALDPGLLALRRIDPLQLLPSSQNGSAAPASPVLVWVRARGDLRSFEACQEFVRHVRAAAAQFAPGRYLLTARPVFAAEISAQMQRDMIIMVGVAVGLVAAVFWIYYRTLAALGAILWVQALSVLAALTVGRLCFGELNVIGVSFAAVLLGVGIDYSILVFHHFAMGERMDSPHWPVLRRAVRLSALTTAGAFGVLALAQFPMLRQLAVLVAAGLPAAAWFSTTLLADHFERRPPPPRRRLTGAAHHVADFIDRFRRVIAVTGALVIVTAAVVMPAFARTGDLFDPDLQHFRPLQLEAYRGQAALEEHYARMSADAPAARALGSAAVRRNLAHWTPGRAEAVRTSLRDAGFEDEWAAPTASVLAELDVAAADPAGLAELADGGIWRHLSEELGTTALADLQRLSGVALVGILILCYAAHRSLKLVLLNAATLVAAFALLFGGLALTETPLTLVSVLCLPLLIGLTIDYSLHVLLVLEHCAGNLREATERLGVPISLAALTAMAGFGAPMLSGLPLLSNFGFVMDLGTLAAVLAALFFLPAWHVLGRAPKPPAPEETGPQATPRRYPIFHSGPAYALGAWTAQRVPRGFLRALAHLWARLFAAGNPPATEVLLRNLSLVCHPPPDKKAATRTYLSFAESLADYYWLGGRTLAQAQELIGDRRGIEILRSVHEGGRGALLLTAHLSLFELGGVALKGILDCSIVALSLPESSPALSEWRAAFRRRWGVETLEVGGDDQFTFLEISRLLAAGSFVAALVDRPHGTMRSKVRLPYGEALFSSGILMIAAARRCPVVPVTVIRRDDGRYDVEAHEPFFVVRRESNEATLQHYSQVLADVFAPIIQRHPEQWYQFAPLLPSSSPSSPA